MAPGYDSELNRLIYGTPGGHCPYPPTIDFYTGLYGSEHSVPAYSTATTLSAQHTVVHDSGFPSVLPIINSADPLPLPASQGNAALISAGGRDSYQHHVSTSTSCLITVSYLNLFQHTYLTYAEKATQTVNLDALGKSDGHRWQEEHQKHSPPTTRKIAPQEVYKLPRQPTNFGKPDTIEFVVNGKEGIRLSDASEQNWVGFKGGDDRSLFKGDRLQIMIRLRVSHSAGVHC